MLNALNFGSPVRLRSLAANPASPENGLMYYNTAVDALKSYVVYADGAFDYLTLGSETDAIEGSIGSCIDTDGAWIGFSGTTNLDAVLSITDALETLDSALGAVAVSLQDAYDGGQTISTTAINTPVTISGTTYGLIVSAAGGVRTTLLEKTDGANIMQAEYLHGINLASGGGATNVAELTNVAATWPSVIINYTVIGDGNDRRVGRLLVTYEADTNTTSISDDFTETAALGLVFSADINAGNMRVLCNNTSATAGTMNAEITRFPA
jgi:hypothetical protein